MTQAAPLANLFTLGVRDFPVQRDFYRALGWPQIAEEDDFAAFQLRGSVLCLFPVDKLAADGRARPEEWHGGVRFTIAIIVDTPDEVDQVTAAFEQAGGSVTKPPVEGEYFEGRSAYVADPEGNYYEIAWASPDNHVVAAARRAAGE